MAKQCWSQTVLESGSWGHSVLQTPALVFFFVVVVVVVFPVIHVHAGTKSLIIKK